MFREGKNRVERIMEALRTGDSAKIPLALSREEKDLNEIAKKYCGCVSGVTQADIDAVCAALTEKGVTVPDDATVADMAGLIDGIATQSPNGTDWTKISAFSASSISIICNAAGKWLCALGSNGLYYSTDGINWVRTSFKPGNIKYIACANGKWVSGTNTGLYYSDDGITWTQSNITSGTFERRITYGNGLWHAGAATCLYYSADGMTWTLADGISVSAEVMCANGKWVAATNTGLYYSDDGITWTQSNITSGTARFPKYADGIWVASVVSQGLYYSDDGMTWTQSNTTSTTIMSIAYGNGVWLAGASTGLYRSDDGKKWSQNSYSGNYRNIAYACGVWVAASGGATSGYVRYSTDDGQNWANSNLHIKASALDSATLMHANGVWLIGGDNSGLYYSVTWKPSA